MKESDLHTKRTGHTEFTDKTAEGVKPISLEVPKAKADDEDMAEVGDDTDDGTGQHEGSNSLLSQILVF